MPGTEDGSSRQNAKEWDHSIYPGGTRVYDAFTYYYSGTSHWWAAELKGGVQYIFQTRLPTAYKTVLYLYNESGSQLAYNYFDGDDAYGLSKIVYTIPSDGMYFLWVRGYSYYDYGPYVLECVPAPVSIRVVNIGGYRMAARRGQGGINLSRSGIIKDLTATAFANRFLSRSVAQAANQNRIEARQVAATSWPNRFRIFKHQNGVLGVSRFDVRRSKERISPSRNGARQGQTARSISRYNWRQFMEAILRARYDWRTVHVGQPAPARHDALVLPGWAIYARNAQTSAETFLGFIPEDAITKDLLDVPIPDGVYEIEARPSQYYWDECRGRRIVTLIAGEVGGGGEPLQGLPVIQNLRREIISFRSVIRWKVTEEYESGAFEFGLWFSPTTPVDTSGPPDQTVPYAVGVGDYQAIRQQTATEYVAVAAFTSTEVGDVAKLHMPWSTNAPGSPSDQFAYRQPMS